MSRGQQTGFGARQAAELSSNAFIALEIAIRSSRVGWALTVERENDTEHRNLVYAQHAKKHCRRRLHLKVAL